MLSNVRSMVSSVGPVVVRANAAVPFAHEAPVKVRLRMSVEAFDRASERSGSQWASGAAAATASAGVEPDSRSTAPRRVR